MSRSVFEPLADRSPNAIVVTTLGILLVLSEASRIAADTHDLWLPPMLAQPVIFAQNAGFKATLTLIQLLDCAAVIGVLALTAWAFARSGFGRPGGRCRTIPGPPRCAASTCARCFGWRCCSAVCALRWPASLPASTTAISASAPAWFMG
ncbi:hypothetical protein AJ88_32560 [Mesorhizobium amorphae CCBAU 01583]|nr:hypothetical protein AJ88_32560 [Mesorhizobium amorphae CCBAU 01583]